MCIILWALCMYYISFDTLVYGSPLWDFYRFSSSTRGFSSFKNNEIMVWLRIPTWFLVLKCLLRKMSTIMLGNQEYCSWGSLYQKLLFSNGISINRVSNLLSDRKFSQHFEYYLQYVEWIPHQVQLVCTGWTVFVHTVHTI